VVQQPAALAAQAALAGRWQVQGGDFFRAVPAGADTCVRKRASCTTGATRSAGRVAPGRRARLRVVDAVLPGGNAPHPAKVMGILMMVFGSGRERTPAEFAARRTRAGRRLDAARGSASPLSVAKAVPD
jgi:hypothetical protein